MPEKEYDPRMEIIKRRDYKVVKANDIIQQAKYDLNITELKILNYIFSMIRPTDTPDHVYLFTVKSFCEVCGINSSSGTHYDTCKKYLKGLRDKSFWLVKEDGSQTTVGWLSKATIVNRSGSIEAKLDEDLAKYVMHLSDNTPYTQYELICTLPMKSQYSLKMFDLLSSYKMQKKVTFGVDELKQYLYCESYSYKDFRVRCIEKSVQEINEYTDIEVVWHKVEPISGKKITQLTFEITRKDPLGRLESHTNAEIALKPIESQKEEETTQ